LLRGRDDIAPSEEPESSSDDANQSKRKAAQCRLSLPVESTAMSPDTRDDSTWTQQVTFRQETYRNVVRNA
jgi:hypothetical protein